MVSVKQKYSAFVYNDAVTHDNIWRLLILYAVSSRTPTNFLSSFTSSINLLSAPPGFQILLPDSLYSLSLLLTCQNHLSHSGLIPTTPNISFVPLMDSFLTHHCYNPKRICTWGSPAALFLTATDCKADNVPAFNTLFSFLLTHCTSHPNSSPVPTFLHTFLHIFVTVCIALIVQIRLLGVTSTL